MRRTATACLVVAAALALPRTSRADVRVFTNPDPAADTLRSLDLYGWVQPRFSWQQTDTRPEVNLQPHPSFTLRRARLGGVAKVNEWLRAQFELELSVGVELYDAFLVAQPLPEIGASAGQMRVPFSRQNMMSSRALQFPDMAYFIAPKFVVDRDIGAMLQGKAWDGKVSYAAGVFNGNDPGRNQRDNNDDYLLFAARVEATPFAPVPRFEGDLRSDDDRKKPALNVGVGAMHNRLEDKHFNRTYLGADLAFYFRGASLYAELYGRRDADDSGAPTCSAGSPGWVFHDDTTAGRTCVTAVGWNVQAGYFPDLPFARDHVELALRVQRFDPVREVDKPQIGERELEGTNPTWGYQGTTIGLNLYARRAHDAKLQASYEIRNETKACLEGQGDGTHACTGHIRNNLFLLQATAAF